MCVSTLLLSGMVGVLMMCGLFISLNILKFPDFSSEVSYALGCSAYLFFQLNNCNTIVTMVYIFLLGALCGVGTVLLMQYIKIPRILSGFIVLVFMFGFLSLGIRFGSNIHYVGKFSVIGTLAVVLFTLILVYVLSVFMRSEAGIRFRALHHENNCLVENSTKFSLGLAVSSGIIAIAGGISHQLCSIGQVCCWPCGTLLFGTSVMLITERIFSGKRYDILRYFICVLTIGAVYRIFLQVGANAFSPQEVNSFMCVISSIVIVVTYLCVKDSRSKFLNSMLKKVL